MVSNLSYRFMKDFCLLLDYAESKNCDILDNTDVSILYFVKINALDVKMSDACPLLVALAYMVFVNKGIILTTIAEELRFKTPLSLSFSSHLINFISQLTDEDVFRVKNLLIQINKAFKVFELLST